MSASGPSGPIVTIRLILILASALPVILLASQRTEIVSNNYYGVILLFTLVYFEYMFFTSAET